MPTPPFKVEDREGETAAGKYTVTVLDAPSFTAKGFVSKNNRPHASVNIHDANGIRCSQMVHDDGEPSFTLDIKGPVPTSVTVFGLSLRDLLLAVVADGALTS